MKELTVGDVHLVVTRLPKDVREMCKKHGFIIGGGFIRETIAGGEVKDIDLFGSSEGVMQAAALLLTEKRQGNKFSTGNAITVLTQGRLPVQFITRWIFDTPKKCVESFDYTVCQAGVFFDSTEKKWGSYAHDYFYSDLAARRLVYTFPTRDEEAGGSMMRMVKFLRRGYNIQSTAIAGVMSRSVAKLREDIIGNEVLIAQVLKGMLIEVDPLEVIDGIELAENEHLEL
jgi:hypothetical protein